MRTLYNTVIYINGCYQHKYYIINVIKQLLRFFFFTAGKHPERKLINN